MTDKPAQPLPIEEPSHIHVPRPSRQRSPAELVDLSTRTATQELDEAAA
jgi:hypothetical protein